MYLKQLKEAQIAKIVLIINQLSIKTYVESFFKEVEAHSFDEDQKIKLEIT